MDMYKGFKYYFSAQVSVVYFSEKLNPLFNQFGIAFCEDEVNFETPYNKQSFFFISYAIDYKKRLELDTAVWTKWSGTYVANGYEKYLVLGCLKPISEISFYPRDSTDGLFYFSANLCHDAFTLIPIPELPKDTLFCEGDTINLALVNKPDFLPKTLYSCAKNEIVLKAGLAEYDSV